MTKGFHIHIRYTIPRWFEKELTEEEAEFDLVEDFNETPLNLGQDIAEDFWDQLVTRERRLIKEKIHTSIDIQGRYEICDLKFNSKTIKHWSRKEEFGV